LPIHLFITIMHVQNRSSLQRCGLLGQHAYHPPWFTIGPRNEEYPFTGTASGGFGTCLPPKSRFLQFLGERDAAAGGRRTVSKVLTYTAFWPTKPSKATRRSLSPPGTLSQCARMWPLVPRAPVSQCPSQRARSVHKIRRGSACGWRPAARTAGLAPPGAPT